MQRRDHLGPYRLVRRVGAGGMAEVWEALKDGAPAPVAIKMMPLDESAGPTTIDRFLDEGRLCARLAHPNIVQVLDVGVAEDRAYIVMELLTGRTLSRLGATPKPPGFVAALAVQLLAGLEHAHREPFEVVHRDIKPSNLFLTGEGIAKVIDFGIANTPLLDRTLTRTGNFRGSLAYAAPEQVRGEKRDQRMDLFSLGLVLRELLTGQRAFPQTSEAELMGQLLFSKLRALDELLPGLDREFASVLDWGLQQKVEDRPRSAAGWAEAIRSTLAEGELWTPAQLAGWLREQPVEATAEKRQAPRRGPPETASAVVLERAPDSGGPHPGRRRAPRWLLLGALGLAGMLGLGAAWGLGRHRSPAEVRGERGQAPVAVRSPVTPEPTPAPTKPPENPVPVKEPPAPVHRVAHHPAGPTRKHLAPASPQGWVTVEARPQWARVYLNGQNAGPTPLYRQAVPAGRLLVEGVREDGSRQKRYVNITGQHESIVVLEW